MCLATKLRTTSVLSPRRSGNACDLQRRVGGTDMRVEPAAGAGYGVDRNCDIRRQSVLLSVFLRQLPNPGKGLVSVSRFWVIRLLRL